MIIIYQHPTEKNTTMGMMLTDFKDSSIRTDYRKFESVYQAEQYLSESKHTVLCHNIEAFRMFAEQTFPPENTQISHLVRDSIRIIHELTILIINNPERKQFCFESVIESANFMRVLVKNAPEESKPHLIMIASQIIEFCKKELESCQKQNNP